MNKRTLSIYEMAWSMYQVGSTIDQITEAVGRHRATIYRWIQEIKRTGIKEFIRRKKEAKHRRPASRIPEHTIQKVIDIRVDTGWCGAKIQKELREIHGIRVGLSTIYRYLRKRLLKTAVGINRYVKHQAIVTASAPREVIEHDTVDLGGLYAYTAIDIFTKEPQVYIGTNLEMATGAKAFKYHTSYYHQGLASNQLASLTHQSDNGSEFQSDFTDAIEASGTNHRYSRPYKKNEQAHIENFNKALRNECFGHAYYRKDELEELRLKANLFTKHYINRRWHMGLPEMMTPAQFRQYYHQNPQTAKLALARVY